MDLVSIPIGFSSSLQRRASTYTLSSTTCFNPYRVFKFAATIAEVPNSQPSKEFQSLSGFQVRCNPERSRVDTLIFVNLGFNPYRVFKFAATLTQFCRRSIRLLFQSLSGFQVRCNPTISEQALIAWKVSIPIGFSSSLQLQVTYIMTLLAEDRMFQSLSGFQVRCN